MELIIKPTSVCNFNCSFCAASDLSIKHPGDKVPDKIKETIALLKPNSIIITGGEPLCCSPAYYEDLLTICDCNISLTTNLKDFYLHPDKWIKLLSNQRVYVCTSFNYGNSRRWENDKIYTEEEFKKVMELFKEKIGYTPMFISVIDKDNEDDYLKHIYLAKELGTVCRLNNALKIGKQDEGYPKYKMFQKWIELIELGLDEYEMNCIERRSGKCPINTNSMCSTTIKSIYLDRDDNLHISNCEEKLNIGTEIADKEDINKDCIYCELYRVCNACDINNKEAKAYPEYCTEMIKLKKQIIDRGWRL